MAETFFTEHTRHVLSSILEPQYNGSVGRAAAWADQYSHTTEGRFSYQWHWIDTHDRAPEYCNLEYSKDCAKGGCVVSAIANQTGILRECVRNFESGALSDSTNLTCSYALKWVAHFLGDIHQPLHANGRAVGGYVSNQACTTRKALTLTSEQEHLQGHFCKCLDATTCCMSLRMISST